MRPIAPAPQYGAPTGFNIATMDRTKLAAVVIVASAAIVLLASLSTLYSVTVTPSAATVPNNHAPSQQPDPVGGRHRRNGHETQHENRQPVRH
jgi:hypothetical protein